jgi:hypothetical protein
MYSRVTTTRINYDHKGRTWVINLNPFKLGTMKIPKTILVGDQHLVQGEARVWMIPFFSLTRWHIKGTVNA